MAIDRLDRLRQGMLGIHRYHLALGYQTHFGFLCAWQKHGALELLIFHALPTVRHQK